MRIGIFGGSFDPPHVGHVALAAMACSLVDLEQLLVVPCFDHAFGKRTSGFDHRFAMCELAFRPLRNVTVSDVERRIGGTSFTLRTLRQLSLENPGAELALIVGADAYEARASWHRFDEVERAAEIVVFGRSGVTLDEPSLPSPPPVSATEIREAIARAESVERLVPRAVLRYIAEHGLYRDPIT